ncbi:MAG: NUDIX hydrolase [Nanobdellota archaeon]
MVVTTDDGSIVLSGVCIVNKKDELLLLLRRDHGHLETPGGKLEENDCDEETRSCFSEDDLQRCSIREMFEELGQGFIVEELDSLGSVSFTLPDGRNALAFKFFTRLLYGEPAIQENEIFSDIQWVPVTSLENREDLSPDLSHFINAVREKVEKK